MPSEVSVTDEVSKWAAFQQQILGITMLLEQQISMQSEIEDSKKQLSTTSHANPVSSHLRLIVEHLVESLLNTEKKDKVEARSLRGLYDVMVSR